MLRTAAKRRRRVWFQRAFRLSRSPALPEMGPHGVIWTLRVVDQSSKRQRGAFKWRGKTKDPAATQGVSGVPFAHNQPQRCR